VSAVPGRLALAGGVRLPAVWREGGLGARAPASVGVRGLWPADVGDRGHRDAQDADAVAELVLGRVPGRHHHPGISAKLLQRQLGLRRYETAWLILQKLRRAMVAPEREPLKGEVEIDEFYLGGLEEGRRGGREAGEKALCGIAIEVRGRALGGFAFRSCPTPRAARWGRSRRRPPPAGRSSTPTAGRAITGSRGLAMTTALAASARSPVRSCSPVPTAPSPTSRPGCAARIATSPTSTCPSTSTSTCSGTTVAAPQWPLSRLCSACPRLREFLLPLHVSPTWR
jgi:hypothetical protein